MKSSHKAFLLISLLTVIFFHQSFFGKVAAPLDVIVGIYHPFRDHVWNGLIAGVPFKNSLLSDVVAIIIPWKFLGTSQFLDGLAPLWNPYSGASVPLLANFQSGLLYPFNIIFILLTKIKNLNGFLSAWNIYIFLTPFLSALFSYLFLKQKKVGNFGALFGSIVFSFSGFMMTWLEYGVVGHAFLWLPLMLFSADKVINDSKLKYLPLISLSISMSLLAGYPQMSVYAILALVLFIIFAVAIDVKTISRKISLLLLLSLFSVLGIALSAVQLIPGIELLINSLRESDPVISSLNYGFLPLQNLITLFAPDIFGNPVTGNYFGKFSYNDTAFYISILPLALAFLAPIFQRNRGVRFFLLLLGISLLLSIESPISKLIYSLQIPGLSGGIASRALSLFDFSIAMLSGYGLDNLIKNRNKKELFKAFLSITLIFSLILFALWAVVFSQNLEVSKRNLILPTTVAFGSFILIFSYIKLKCSKLIFLAVLFLISFELMRQGLKYNPFTPKEYFYPQTEITNFLKNNTTYERISGTIPTNMTIPYGFYSPESYDALLLKRYSEFLGIINNAKPISGSRYGEVINYKSNLINLLGIKYILTIPEDYKSNFKPEEKDFPKDRFKKVFQYGKTSVYENKNVLPHAFLVGDYVSETDPQKIAGLLLAKDFNLRKSVILERDINIPKNPCDGQTEIKDYKANKINIFVNSPSTCLLFLSDNYYPGWIAKVDGEETEILRANFTFRAVKVSQGEHIVNFEYQPKSFKIGLYLTAASVIALIIFAALLKKNEN